MGRSPWGNECLQVSLHFFKGKMGAELKKLWGNNKLKI